MSNESRRSPSNKTHGMSKMPIYSAWTSMVQRCTNPKDPKYYAYGAKGITVCDRWRSFSNFIEDMGPRPEGFTLDRIDGTKGYYKENCRWATVRQQAWNQRTNRIITHNGESKCLAEWASIAGMRAGTLRYRIEQGMDFAEALSKPLKPWPHDRKKRTNEVRK